MSKRDGRVLFLGKENDAHAERAAGFCRMNFSDVSVHVGNWGDPLPDQVRDWRGRYIISYLSRWIVPQCLLEQASVAINFHPGPPEYPGYGCNNFAIYDEVAEYGVMCHHMAAEVDSGPVIAVRRFPVFASDTADTLLSRAYDWQLVLFYEIMTHLIRGETLPASGENWSRKPFTKRQFQQLLLITPDMSKQEIARRIRASTLSVSKPTLELRGFFFQLRTD